MICSSLCPNKLLEVSHSVIRATFDSDWNKGAMSDDERDGSQKANLCVQGGR